ncbi:DUF1624 domain-containing protein [Candidatus Micrarchaeota archaeon]|nr:DUF1624 domain-containing protein [Candidatus Micrarchaeota archaeon]
MGKRFIEIDALRGIAILMMVLFHFVFDLKFLGIYDIEPYEGFWLIFQRTTASLFILLVGIGLSLMNQKYGNNYLTYFKRGLFILGLGFLVTLATYIYPGEGVIVFGILHFIGISILVTPLFFRFNYLNLGFAALIIFAGFNLWTVDTNLLIWLGLAPEYFYTLDYFPLLPWFGLVLIGLVLGKYFYNREEPGIELNLKGKLVQSLAYLGQKSLLIYLIHQPIILGILLLATGKLSF